MAEFNKRPLDRLFHMQGKVPRPTRERRRGGEDVPAPLRQNPDSTLRPLPDFREQEVWLHRITTGRREATAIEELRRQGMVMEIDSMSQLADGYVRAEVARLANLDTENRILFGDDYDMATARESVDWQRAVNFGGLYGAGASRMRGMAQHQIRDYPTQPTRASLDASIAALITGFRAASPSFAEMSRAFTEIGLAARPAPPAEPHPQAGQEIPRPKRLRRTVAGMPVTDTRLASGGVARTTTIDPQEIVKPPNRRIKE